MPSRARLDWNGDRLVEQLRHDAALAVNDTVDAARDDARVTHPWKDDPGLRTHKRSGRRFDSRLELQIESEHARAADPNPTARFGYTRRKGFYGLFHEDGTVHEHEYPTLRPAADRHFHGLAARLAERFRRRLQ